MFDLTVVEKVKEVEHKTGQSISTIMAQVPFGNVLTAFQKIQVPDLIEMISSVPIAKLVYGLRVITPDEISQIDVEKLKIVLLYGNMKTVEQLQYRFGSRSIIIAISKMDPDTLKTVLENDNITDMFKIIDKLAYEN